MERTGAQTGFPISLPPEMVTKLNAIKQEARRREIENEDLEMWEVCKNFLEAKGVNSGTRYQPLIQGAFTILAQEIDRNGNPVEGGNHVPAQVALMFMGERYDNCIDVRITPTAHGPRLPFSTGGSFRVFPAGYTRIHEGWVQGERPPRPLEHTYWKGIVDLVRQDLAATRAPAPAT